MEFRIEIAGKVIGISSLYDEVYDLCKGYYTEDSEDFHVTTSESDIQFEHDKSISEAIFEGNPPYEYEKSYYETLAVYRKIAVKMLQYDTWLMHGAVVATKDMGAVIFTAPSGIGKTTHMKLWLEHIPGAFVVNGDKPLIRLSSAGYEVCGTPWAGKEGLQTNTIMPLKAVCFIERGEVNQLDQMTYSDAYPMLIQQTYRPSDKFEMSKTLSLIMDFGRTVPLYRMKCNMNPEAAYKAYEVISSI